MIETSISMKWDSPYTFCISKSPRIYTRELMSYRAFGFKHGDIITLHTQRSVRLCVVSEDGSLGLPYIREQVAKFNQNPGQILTIDIDSLEISTHKLIFITDPTQESFYAASKGNQPVKYYQSDIGSILNAYYIKCEQMLDYGHSEVKLNDLSDFFSQKHNRKIHIIHYESQISKVIEKVREVLIRIEITRKYQASKCHRISQNIASNIAVFV